MGERRRKTEQRKKRSRRKRRAAKSNLMPGSLTVIGTGYRIGGHITSESLAHLRIAEKVFANVDSVTYEWLSQINPATETLLDCYAEGKERRKTYRQMVNRILAQVRANR